MTDTSEAMTTSSRRTVWGIVALVLTSACASAPPAPAPPAPQIPFEKKMAWILQLEDQRLLRIVPPAAAPAVPVAAPPRRRGIPVTAPAPPAIVSDLSVLAKDPEPRIRRRAALAIGRVGLKDGIGPLLDMLADQDPEVRAMAAFAVGLIGVAAADAQPIAAEAASRLSTALADPDPLVRGRAAEALGQIGAKEAAAAIGQMAAEYARSPAVSGQQPDDEHAGGPEAEAFRLGLFALVRLHAYEPIAGAALDASGRPVSTWWPVAYALQRVGDPRAQPALLQLLRTPGKYTAAFAARGLGAATEVASAEALVPVVSGDKTPLEVRIAAIRALAQIGDVLAVAPLIRLASSPAVDANIRLETIAALGTLHAADALPIVQDLLTDPWPPLRAAALRAAVSIDRENFLLVLASLEPDPQWPVRAALAEVLGTLGTEGATERLRAMTNDEDKRVLPSVLTALVRVRAQDAGPSLVERLKDPDFALRATAARLIGELKPAGGADALKEALTLAQGDAAYAARGAILAALAEFGAAEATGPLKAALTDKDWAIRIRAAALLAKLDPAGEYQQAIRPAPGAPTTPYDDPETIAPAYSPHVFIETAKGTIEFELAVLDAPQTTRNFIALARKGFFNGLQIHRVVPNFVVQDGDPRGDGEGGPGYTIRDELNPRPFLRGTVGMALDWRDTGGSQFFITHSPQPHLDARYTVFGHVVNGMEVVDRIQQGDTIQRVRIWDGKTMQ